MVPRLVFQTTAASLVLALLLFGPAGTLGWRGGWDFLGLFWILGVGVGLWLARTDPALLEQRMASPVRKDQKPWDRIFISVIGLAFLEWLAAMGWEVGRYGMRTPLWVQAAGAGLIVLCYLGVAMVFRENSFAIPVVALQADRGQTVVSTGPYALVRHPMYAAGLLFFVGAPLVLGSWWGLASVPVALLLFAARALGEERMLEAELPGYADYALRVRARLLPWIW